MTLPDPETVPNGAVITVVQSASNTGGIVNCPGGVTINGVMDGSSGASVNLTNCAKYEFVRVSATAYQMHTHGGGRLLAASGWQRLPSGFIMQWGTATTGAGGTVAISFPLTYPTAADSWVGTAQDPGGSVAETVTFQSLTVSGVTGVVTNSGGGGITGIAMRWISFGR
jgi:hypothetical protein